MKCAQTQRGDGFWFCAVCQVATREKTDRECQPHITGDDCVHLGAQIGTRACATCNSGNVRLKVFACGHPLHRETTLPECATCRDFRAS